MGNFSMTRRGTLTVLLGGAAVAGLPGMALSATPATPIDGLPRARPEDEGIDPQAIINFLEEIESSDLGFNSFMLARNGRVVAEGYWSPYRADLNHFTHSLTKSVTGTALGLALDEGHFSLDDKVTSFFGPELPETISENLALMTVRDLASMHSGHDVSTSGTLWRPIQTSWVAEFFKIPVVHRPGTFFKYTSANSYMLSAIITRTTGMSMLDYLRPRFFEPMEIEGFEWESGPENITPGANGLSWKVADSLKLGILYQQMGRFNDRQIIPEWWVTMSQQPQGSPRYGFQWWRGEHGRFSANGQFGQFTWVYPEDQAVLAMMSALPEDGGRERWNALQDKHMPAMFRQEPKPAANDTAFARLTELTEGLAVPVTLGKATSPTAGTVSGRTYRMEENEDGLSAVRFDFTDEQCTVTLTDARGEHTVVCGLGTWIEGRTSVTGNRLHHEYQFDNALVTAGAGWTDDNTLEMYWQFIETVWRDRVLCRFEGDELRFDRSTNVNSALEELPTVVGRSA